MLSQFGLPQFLQLGVLTKLCYLRKTSVNERTVVGTHLRIKCFPRACCNFDLSRVMAKRAFFVLLTAFLDVRVRMCPSLITSAVVESDHRALSLLSQSSEYKMPNACVGDHGGRIFQAAPESVPPARIPSRERRHSCQRIAVSGDGGGHGARTTRSFFGASARAFESSHPPAASGLAV